MTEGLVLPFCAVVFTRQHAKIANMKFQKGDKLVLSKKKFLKAANIKPFTLNKSVIYESNVNLSACITTGTEQMCGIKPVGF